MGLTNTPSDLLPGTLELLILRALVSGSKHGYGIVEHIRVTSEDILKVGESALYPALQRLLVNGWALYQLGALVEVLFGTARLAAIYFASGLAGSLASVAWDLVSGRQQPSVGASGAIFGLLGALIAFLLRHRDRLRPEARSLLLQLLFWAGINIVFGFTADMIDNAAHLGGLAAGLAIGATLRPAHAGGGA